MRTEPLVIYHKSQPLCRAEKWSFYDKAQNVGGQYISTTIKSPIPITFSIGDYCDYRGERYYMNNLPSVTQQAKPRRYGEGFVYDNVRFDGASFELCRIIMLDITPTTGLYIPKKGTNYTGSSNFQLYCAETRLTVDGTERIYPAVCTLVGKIQANLDRAFPTLGWKILVDTATMREVKGKKVLCTHTDDKVISFNNTTVANALAEVSNIFKLNFHIKGRTIYIGYTLGAVTGNFMGDSGVVGDNDYYYLGYGRGYADKEHPGRGLYEIKKSSDASQQIITRLRAMGSTKNMPFMYYNKRYALSQDLYPSNLQLPDTFKSPQEKQDGHQRRKSINKSVYEVHGETNDAYLDKYNDISRCKEGLREGVAIWDGSNGLPEIYPTIEKMTYGELRGNDCPDMLDKKESNSFGIVNGHASFYYYDNDERVDEILAVGKVEYSDTTDDANLGNGLLRPDTLEGSGKIDCPCEMNQYITISHQITKVDRGYDLFPPIRLQPKGKYNLSPIAAGMRVELFINTGRHESAGKHVSCTFHYEIILEKVSLKDNEKKEIGCYKSKEIQVSSGTYEKPGGFINLPKIPDLFDDEKEEGKKRDAQIKEIYLESVSDIYATIVFHIDNVHTDVEDDTYITIHVGNPTFGDGVKLMKDKPKVYVWECALEDEKEVNKPFHVIIKDIGISRFVSQFSNGGQAILSMKDGGCLARNFVIGNDVKRVTYTKNGNTYNGWQLELTRATDDSIHRYYPNQTDRLQAGDHYVLLGIPMPDAYVQAAEMRLLVAASQYLRDNSRTKYNYEPKVDELFLARNYDRCASRNAKEQSIYWNLYAGLRLPFFGSPKTDKADEELPLVNIPIESLTIKEGDGIIPTVEIHLREGRSQSTIHQINVKVDALYDGMNRGNGGMTLSDTNTPIFRTGVKYFLRNDVADTAKEVITFLKGIVVKAVSYFEGIVNRGNINNTGDIHNTGNINNTGNITTNNLTVTDKATFFELEILKAKAAGGIIIQSAATFKVDDFEDTAEGYVCYQLAEKDGKVLQQMCDKFDLMLCHGGLNVDVGVSHNVSNHYYWRMVTDAPEAPVERGGKKYLKIVLSKTDFATGSDKPQVGDELAQVGNRVNKERQCVMMSCAYKGLDTELKPPYWAHYMGVNNYDISTHRYTWFAANGSQVTGNFKVRSDNGGLELVEDYMKNLVQESYTRPNLLWGSDLNLDGVDATSKAAIQKHLGVGLNATKVDNTEWFEYLKGGGIGGADAIKAKVAVVNGEGNGYAGLYWQIGFGAKSNVKVKPNTRYTFSFWIRTEILQGRGYAVAESFNMESLTGGRKDRTMPWTDVKATNEWERKSYTFTTGATGYIMVGVGLSGEDNFSGLIYLCHPKLEEGDTATPWCAYGDMTGHSLVANAFMEGTYRNGCTKGVKNYVRVFYDGQEVKDFKVSYRYKGGGYYNWSEPESKSSDYWGDTQRDGSTIFVEYVVEYKGLKALATGRLDNIQDGKDGDTTVVYTLIPVEEYAVAYLTDDKKKRVDVSLKYRVRQSYGDNFIFFSGSDLRDHWMVLLVDGESWSFDYNGDDGAYCVQKKGLEYKERPNNSYTVTLRKEAHVMNRRVLPITFNPNLMFDFGKQVDGLDGKINGIAGKVSTLDGRVSGFEITIDHFRTEVKDKVSRSELKQTAKSIVAKVGSSVNANLLWGSDLDLSQVQDVMENAYKQSDIIKNETEKKAEWKRSRDNADSDDDRMRYQKGMDDCDRKIAQAQGNVAKCKEAIRKRLGIVISGDMEFGNREMFQYLKGEGVGGSDAIHFKNVYKREGWAKWTNLGWNDVPLKPNTKYTISVWVKFKSYGKKGRMYIDCASNDGRYCFGGYLYKEHYYDRADIDEWQRVRYMFNSGASKRLSALFFSCIADEEEDAQCEIWFCRPKLEEGEVATPWCAYDGTVDALLAGGFDIKEKKFAITSDNFVVQNNRGEQTFLIDKNGKINNGMLSLDGLDAKRAVIKNLRFQSNSVAPYFVTEESMEEFTAYCTRRYAGWGHDLLFPFDIATFFVFLVKPRWYARISQGQGRKFSLRNRDIAVSESMAHSFVVDYYYFAFELFWHNMVGKTVTIANSTNEKIQFGAKLKTKILTRDGKRIMQIGGRLDNLPDFPINCVEFVDLLPGQMASFKYTLLSGAPTYGSQPEAQTEGYFLLQDLFDFSYYKKLFEVGYYTEQGFNLFDKKYLDLFNTDEERVEPKGGFPKTKR